MKIPAIAQHRRQDAIEKFAHKLNVLERLISEGKLETYPKRASISTFAAWTDIELGVSPLSRSILYDDAQNYINLQQRMKSLLDRLALLRSKKSKKISLESDLRLKLVEAQAQLSQYVDQYSTAREELRHAREEIERLNMKLARYVSKRSKVVPLHSVQNVPVQD